MTKINPGKILNSFAWILWLLRLTTLSHFRLVLSLLHRRLCRSTRRSFLLLWTEMEKSWLISVSRPSAKLLILRMDSRLSNLKSFTIIRLGLSTPWVCFYCPAFVSLHFLVSVSSRNNVTITSADSNPQHWLTCLTLVFVREMSFSSFYFPQKCTLSWAYSF